MKKVSLILVASIFISLALIFTLVIFIFPKRGQERGQVCFQKTCFLTELATTPKAQAKGLMFRNKLAVNRGMLFIFPKAGVYPFWMKNTYVPLDIIWLDQNQKVVFIKNGAQPCLVSSCPLIYPSVKAKYVLEINAGLAQSLHIHLGDKARIKYFKHCFL